MAGRATTEDLGPADASAPAVGRLYAGVFLLFLLTYGLTTQRGPAWQDSGLFQWRILHLDVIGWLGLALAHPLLILLGKAFSLLPLDGLAWRMNLVSAVCGAAAAANVAALVRRLAPHRPAAAWAAAGLLGLAHTAWWLATICESQMVLAALFTAELHILLSLVRRPREHLALLLGGLNGLALTAHNLALLAAPIYGLTVVALCARRRVRWLAVPLLLAGWAAGGAGLLALVAHRAAQTGLAEAVQSALFGQSWRGQVLGGSARAIALGAGYILYNFPNLGLPLAVAGWAALRRQARPMLWPVTALAAIYLLFPIRYAIPDQFMFFVPFYAIVAVLAGLGFAALAEGGLGRRLQAAALASILVGPAIYAAAPAVIHRLGLPLPGRTDLPFRDSARCWLTPWKAMENSAERFARAALAEAPPGGIIIADSTTYYALVWVRREMPAGPTILAVGDARPGNPPIGTPDVMAVSAHKGYYPSWLAGAAEVRKDRPGSVLYRVVWHSPHTAPGAEAGGARGQRARGAPGVAERSDL